ncbi:MAG: NHL repeat-containing protein [Kiritimatiellae bacterium]|nr:NHL repeat-containing protein [Kiritimatiellia bacterium]
MKKDMILKIVIILVLLSVAVVLVRYTSRKRSSTSGNGLGKSFEYDADAFGKIDPCLMIYRELDPIPMATNELYGIAVAPGDDIVVCGRNYCAIYDRTGEKKSEFRLDGVGRCVAVDNDGRIYIGIDDHIEVYKKNGKRKAVWDSVGENATLVSVAVKKKRVFVADAYGRVVLQYKKSGKLLKRIEGFILFSSPSLDVAIDPDKYLWVVNPGKRELRKYDDDGDVLASWQKVSREIDGFSGCCNPMHIAIRSDGAIVTSEKNIVRIKVVDQKGKLIGVVAGQDDFSEGAKNLDIAVDSMHRILVLDIARKSVRVFVQKTVDQAKELEEVIE